MDDFTASFDVNNHDRLGTIKQLHNDIQLVCYDNLYLRTAMNGYDTQRSIPKGRN